MSGKYFAEATLIAQHQRYAAGSFKFAPFDGVLIVVPRLAEVWLFEGDRSACLPFIADRCGEVIGRHYNFNAEQVKVESLLCADGFGTITVEVMDIKQGDETLPTKKAPVKQRTIWEVLTSFVVRLLQGSAPPLSTIAGRELVNDTMAKLAKLTEAATGLDWSPFQVSMRLAPWERSGDQPPYDKAYEARRQRWLAQVQEPVKKLTSALWSFGDGCQSDHPLLGPIEKYCRNLLFACQELRMSSEGWDFERTPDGLLYVQALCDVTNNVARFFEFHPEDAPCDKLPETMRACLRRYFATKITVQHPVQQYHPTDADPM